jgi:hypothetical protein
MLLSMVSFLLAFDRLPFSKRHNFIIRTAATAAFNARKVIIFLTTLFFPLILRFVFMTHVYRRSLSGSEESELAGSAKTVRSI